MIFRASRKRWLIFVFVFWPKTAFIMEADRKYWLLVAFCYLMEHIPTGFAFSASISQKSTHCIQSFHLTVQFCTLSSVHIIHSSRCIFHGWRYRPHTHSLCKKIYRIRYERFISNIQANQRSIKLHARKRKSTRVFDLEIQSIIARVFTKQLRPAYSLYDFNFLNITVLLFEISNSLLRYPLVARKSHKI